MSLTIFANFRINDEERFLRLKDSFFSFKSISAEKWVINVRGRYKEPVGRFLSDNLGGKLELFELNSEEGWFIDSRAMLRSISSDFIFFWVEDQINMVRNFILYDEILGELKDNQIDFFPYSHFGVCKSYHVVKSVSLKRIDIMTLTKRAWKNVRKYSSELYILYIPAIFSRQLFFEIVNSDDPKQNTKWPKDTPFNFEKHGKDVHWLPFKMGIPRSELFVNIDEDHLGYSLITRGLYPNRVDNEVRAGGVTPISQKLSTIKRFKTLFGKVRNTILALSNY